MGGSIYRGLVNEVSIVYAQKNQIDYCVLILHVLMKFCHPQVHSNVLTYLLFRSHPYHELVIFSAMPVPLFIDDCEEVEDAEEVNEEAGKQDKGDHGEEKWG